nr:hypothetical protein [Bdellovibrionales bacterium]
MLKLCTLVLILATSSFALAQTTVETKKEDSGPTLPLIKKVQNHEESRIHLGLNMGINIPEGTRGATPELGIDIGFQPIIPFGLSLELSTSRFDGADDEMHRRTTLMTRGTYNFGGDIPVIKYSFLGVATGVVFLHDGMEMGLAPVMGFDVPLTDDRNCSLGFVAKYLFVTSQDPDSLMTSAALKH